MSEVAFAALIAGAVLVSVVAWATLSGRRALLSRSVLWMAAAGVAIIGLITAIRLAVPGAVQGVAIAVIGVGMSGVLIWLAFRFRDQLSPGRTRQLIVIAVLGVILTVLGAVAQGMRAGR